MNWQPIETAPHGEILCAFQHGGIAVCEKGFSGFWHTPYGYTQEPNMLPTHWMPLPEPPKETP